MLNPKEEKGDLGTISERYAALEEALVGELKSPAAGPARGPSARLLLRRAEEIGFSREEAKQRLGEGLNEPGVHEAWSRWTEVDDKDELRLRLQIARRFIVLPESLLDFALFFFRASDPALYQPAALTLGFHWGQGGALRQKVTEYAGQRGVALDTAVRLTGARSSRRLFLLQAAAAGSRKGGQDSATDPLPGFLATPPELPPDLAAGLLAVEFRLSTASGLEEWSEKADTLLRHLVVDPQRKWDRITVERWARIFSRLQARESARAPVELWLTLLQNLVRQFRLPHLYIGGRINLFLQIDELIRAGASFPENLRKECRNRLSGNFTEETGFFLGLRFDTWRRRKGCAPLRGEAPSIPDGISPEVAALYLAVGYGTAGHGSVLKEDPEIERAAAVVTDLLKLLENRDDWLALSCERRAMAAFLLFDLAMHSPLPPERLETIFRSRGFPLSGKSPSAGGAGPGGRVFSAILLRLLAWEAPGVEVFLDGRLLHQIEDEEVLRALLRERRPGGLLPVLADAFENRLRSRSTREDGFSVPDFLYRISIRRPHSGFYRAFREVVSDRVYQNTGGRRIPVAEMLVRLEAEAALLESDRLIDGTGSGPFPGDGPLSDVLSQLRTDLLAWCAEPGLLRGLERLASLLRGEAEEGEEGRSGLLRLIGRVNGNGGSLERAGTSPVAGVTLEELAAEMSREAGKVVELGRFLQPNKPGDLVKGKEARFALADLLRKQIDDLCPLLPAMEAAILEKGLRDLASRLEVWDQELQKVAQVWEGAEGGESGQGNLFEAIVAVESASLRLGLWRMLARELAAEREREADGFEGSCERLAWGLDRLQLDRLDEQERAVWLEELAAAWAMRLTEAMELKYEGRVIFLVRDSRFRDARMQPGAAEILERVRPWLLDRYHLRHAAAALTGRHGLLKTAGSFFFHFSAVWIALLVGSILMLDFGDAWKAMAEVQDYRGIALTFFLGLGGAFLYLSGDLGKKVAAPPGEKAGRLRLSVLGRTAMFLLPCLAFALAVTGFLWFLLSGTDEVVHGEGAMLHVIVWAGFALFVGIFFGLLAKDAA